MAIEVEIRSFISKEKYDELLKYFSSEGKLVKVEDDETEYYADQGAVRLWRNKEDAKVILKSGKIHDENREEHEVFIKKEDFPLLQKMFEKLGVQKQIKWKRKRHTFSWNGINVQIGDNSGYGYIIELEKMSEQHEKENIVGLLKEKLASLNVELTPREEFERKYTHYKNNWKTLLES